MLYPSKTIEDRDRPHADNYIKSDGVERINQESETIWFNYNPFVKTLLINNVRKAYFKRNPLK